MWEVALGDHSQRVPCGIHRTGISASFTDEEAKTCPHHRALKRQSLVLNPGLLAPSLRPCPLTFRKQGLSLIVSSLGPVCVQWESQLHWGINGVVFGCTSWCF